jgi:hypothetical protein
MKFLLSKTCQGVFDTSRERQRINKAFKRDPEIKKHLLELMDAVEAGQWKKAAEMLDGEWWSGRDKKRECPRLEFCGMLHLMVPSQSKLTNGFDHWADYPDLILAMVQDRKLEGIEYTVTKVPEGK